MVIRNVERASGSTFPATLIQVPMALLFRNSAFSQVTALAGPRPVHAAFAWLHGNPKTIMDWQAALVAIPAPPFGEAGALRVARRAALPKPASSQIETDAVGNVLGFLPAAHLPPESTGPVVVLSAHLDTVFPAETPLNPVVDGDRLEAPGACDNGAGVAGLLAIAHALVHAKVELPAPLSFWAMWAKRAKATCAACAISTSQARWPAALRAHIVLDGAGADAAVTQALGSRRFQVTVTGPGGHSFTDAGTPNPIAALAFGAGRAGRDAAARGAAHHAQPRHHSRRHQREFHPRERAGLHRFPLHRPRRSCCGLKLRCTAPWKTP